MSIDLSMAIADLVIPPDRELRIARSAGRWRGQVWSVLERKPLTASVESLHLEAVLDALAKYLRR